MEENYIQVGETALRAPDGSFLPSVPLYVKAEDVGEEAEERLIYDIGKLFAAKMKDYVAGCEEAGINI